MRRWAGQDIYTHTHARVQNEYLGCEDIVLLADGPCATIPFNDICTYDCIAVVSSKKSMYKKTPPHECFSGAHRSGGSCQPRWRQSSNPTVRVVLCYRTITFTSSFRPSQRRLGQEENTCALLKLTQINKYEKRSTQLTRSTSNTSAIELASTINKSFGHQNQQHNTQKPSQTTPPIQPCPLQPSSPAKTPQPSPQPAERTT